MFVDTSVVVAILADEPDAAELAERIETGKGLTSALVILESTMRLSAKLNLDPLLVESRIRAFLDEARISVVPIDRSTAHLAVQAFATFGRGRGHRATLNFADCLSYACAKEQGVPLLYKGEDLARTDLA